MVPVVNGQIFPSLQFQNELSTFVLYDGMQRLTIAVTYTQISLDDGTQ